VICHNGCRVHFIFLFAHKRQRISQIVSRQQLEISIDVRVESVEGGIETYGEEYHLKFIKS
jgi:hypothetical protein